MHHHKDSDQPKIKVSMGGQGFDFDPIKVSSKRGAKIEFDFKTDCRLCFSDADFLDAGPYLDGKAGTTKVVMVSENPDSDVCTIKGHRFEQPCSKSPDAGGDACTIALGQG